MHDDERTLIGQSLKAKAILVVRQGTQAGMSFPLSGAQTILGREEGTDIVLQDPESSRQHARVSWQAGQFILEDLGSTNGTFVNGVQITAPQVLSPGDSIGIGQTALVFQMTGGPSMTPQPYANPVSPRQPTPYQNSPVAKSDEGNNSLQYALYAMGCLFLAGICVLLLIIAAVIANPTFFVGP